MTFCLPWQNCRKLSGSQTNQITRLNSHLFCLESFFSSLLCPLIPLGKVSHSSSDVPSIRMEDSRNRNWIFKQNEEKKTHGQQMCFAFSSESPPPKGDGRLGDPKSSPSPPAVSHHVEMEFTEASGNKIHFSFSAGVKNTRTVRDERYISREASHVYVSRTNKKNGSHVRMVSPCQKHKRK